MFSGFDKYRTLSDMGVSGVTSLAQKDRHFNRNAI